MHKKFQGTMGNQHPMQLMVVLELGTKSAGINTLSLWQFNNVVSIIVPFLCWGNSVPYEFPRRIWTQTVLVRMLIFFNELQSYQCELWFDLGHNTIGRASIMNLRKELIDEGCATLKEAETRKTCLTRKLSLVMCHSRQVKLFLKTVYLSYYLVFPRVCINRKLNKKKRC